MEVVEDDILGGRCCKGCGSENEVRELVVKGMVIALCKECRKELYDILFEVIWN